MGFLNGVQIEHAEPAVVRVEVGGIDQMIAQMTHEEPSRIIAVERLCHERIFSYFTFHSSISFILLTPYTPP